MKTVGKQLQEARTAREWSPELAARETKIKVERLRDLEADDFSNFSSPTYARGFVRTYARALGLDEYKLLRQLDNKLPEDDNASFANDTGIPYMPEPSKVSNPYRFGAGVYVAMGAGLTVLFLIAFILFQSYRAGYFAQALPALAPASATNDATAVPDADSVTRALPADSNAAPVALPVDVGPATAAEAGTNAAPVAQPINPVAAVADGATNAAPGSPVAANAEPAVSTTPLDTKTPPRALPVDLTALTSTPVTAPAPAAATPISPGSTSAATPIIVAPVTTPVPADPSVAIVPPVVPSAAPAPVPDPAPVLAYRPPPSLSARAANARPDPAPNLSVATGTSAPTPVALPVSMPIATPVTVTPIVAAPSPVAPAPVPIAPAASTISSTATTLIASATPAAIVPPATDAAPALTGESPADNPATPASGTEGKRLVLKASRDSYIRVVSLDNPSGEQVRYSSVLHEGQSISFSDRKYSINIGVPSAVDILLDGINYGPHSDHSEPDTFTVESHQP